MRKHLIVLISILSISTTILAQQYGSFKDARDGKVYKTVRIGSQVWMAENLNVSKFRNGDLIPEAKTEEEWEAAGKNKKPAWCYYENNPANGIRYGKLYNWYVVNDPRGIAPEGWHIASDSEWIQLSEYLGGEFEAHYKMKIKTKIDWIPNTNESGFSGLPGGMRASTGEFWDIENSGGWWSSTIERFVKYPDYANFCVLDWRSNALLLNIAQLKMMGLSVRSIKD